MEHIPQDVLTHIFTFVKPKFVHATLTAVCHQWNEASRDIGLWRHYLTLIYGELDDGLLHMDYKDLVRHWFEVASTAKIDTERAVASGFDVLDDGRRFRLPDNGPLLLVSQPIDQGSLCMRFHLSLNTNLCVGALMSNILREPARGRFEYQLYRAQQDGPAVSCYRGVSIGDGHSVFIEGSEGDDSSLCIFFVKVDLRKRIFHLKYGLRTPMELPMPAEMTGPIQLGLTLWRACEVALLTDKQYKQCLVELGRREQVTEAVYE